MKKIKFLFMSALSLTILAACSSDDDNPDPDSGWWVDPWDTGYAVEDTFYYDDLDTAHGDFEIDTASEYPWYEPWDPMDTLPNDTPWVDMDMCSVHSHDDSHRRDRNKPWNRRRHRGQGK